MRKIGTITLVIGILAFAGSIIYTNQRLKHVSFVEEKFLENINRDVDNLQNKISEATSDYEKYDGGLIKNLLKTRLEILRATFDLLQQRKAADKYNVSINYKGVEHPYKNESHKQQLLNQIDKEIKKQRTELIKTKAKSEMYSGGLIKTLLETSVVTIQMGIDLLETKRLAIEYDVPLFITTTPLEEESEFGSLPMEIGGEATDREREKKPSLLIYWIKTRSANIRSGPSTDDSIVATLKQGDKVYSIEQQGEWHKIKLGREKEKLGWIHSSLLSKSFVEPAPVIEIVDIDARVTESNPTWWKYAWRLTIRNSGSSPVSLTATIEFQDKDGFIIDEDVEYNLYVPAGKAKTFTGYALIDADVARNVSNIAAKVR